MDYFHQIDIVCDVQRNDVPIGKIKEKVYNAIVLSPGPGKPENCGNMMQVIEHYHDKLPILGICLGHQALGKYFGAELKKAMKPMHGKISEMICQEDVLFTQLPARFDVVRYHSLILSQLPSSLQAIGHTQNGEIMAIRHTALPIYGLQFHPEAFLTEYGKELLKNWVFLHKIID